VVEEVEAEIRQVEKELAEAGRIGVKRRVGELSAVRDILYEDYWFRIATAVYAQIMKQFAKVQRLAKSSRRLRNAYLALGLKLS
jgi:hypothetical protein